MERDVLFQYMTGVSVNTGSLVGFYSFNEFSGSFNLNEKYENPKSLIEDGKINYDDKHLVLLGSGKYFNNISGSGDFNRDTVLKIGNKVETSGWTVFLNFDYQDSSERRDLGKVLLSSMESPTSNSGFHIGVNGSNRLYVEYPDINSNKQTFTLNKELSDKNVVSVSKNSSSSIFNLTYYDTPNDRIYSKDFSTFNTFNEDGTNSTNSSDWYLGDFYQQGHGYTGFSGYMGDLLIFDSTLIKINKNDFAKLFFATGYVPEHTQTVTLTTPQVTGAAIQTVVTGSGITGYELVCSSSISSRDGGTVEICSRSGVSGALTGKINVYLTGSGVNSYASGFSVAPEMFLDSGLFYGYNRNTIVFDENLDNLDTYEIYFYDKFKNNLNLKPRLFAGGGYIDLGRDFNNENLNLFENGLYSRSGENRFTGVHDGNYYVTSNRAYVTGDEVSSNTYVYDKIDGDILRSGYSEAGSTFITERDGSVLVDGQEVLVAKVGDTFDDYDIYLNGHKMLSGSQYSYVKESTNLFDDENIYFLKDGFYGMESGDITFVPRESNLTRETGLGSVFSETGSKMVFSEQVWKNGVRQIETLNYYKISENSLLNTGIRIEKQDNLLYNNNNLFFNQ